MGSLWLGTWVSFLAGLRLGVRRLAEGPGFPRSRSRPGPGGSLKQRHDIVLQRVKLGELVGKLLLVRSEEGCRDHGRDLERVSRRVQDRAL